MRNLKKIILTFVLLVVILIPSKTFALEFVDVKDETTLTNAINDGKNVKLTADIENISQIILIDKQITIDLNNHNISFGLNKYFEVYGGNFTLIGKGTVKELQPNYSPIMIYGSSDKTKTDFTTLTVSKDVTIEGWAPLFINYKKEATGLAYGVTVNVYGHLISKNDATGYKGHAMYINGTIKHKENCSIINVYKGATMSTEGDSVVYAAGYAKWNFEDVTITGKIGFGIKAGIFNLKNVNVIANDTYKKEEGYGNGIKSTGAAIQIESKDAYSGGINITIDGGSFTSLHGYAIQHYLDTTTTKNSLESLTINGAKVISIEKDQAITAIANDNIKVVTGTFSSSVSKYITDGYIEEKVNNEYVVAKKEVKVATPTIDTSKKVVEVKEVTIGVKEDKAVSETLQEALKADKTLAAKVEGINAIVEVAVENQEEKVAPKEAVEAIVKLVEESKTVEKTEMKVASFFDITLNVKNNVTGEQLGTLSELGKKISFNVALPEEITKVKEGYTRTYYIVRYHEGKAEILDTKISGNVLTFETDKFSTYAIAYIDTKTETETVVNPNTSDNIILYSIFTFMAIAGIGYTALNIYKRKSN